MDRTDEIDKEMMDLAKLSFDLCNMAEDARKNIQYIIEAMAQTLYLLSKTKLSISFMPNLTYH